MAFSFQFFSDFVRIFGERKYSTQGKHGNSRTVQHFSATNLTLIDNNNNDRAGRFKEKQQPNKITRENE